MRFYSSAKWNHRTQSLEARAAALPQSSRLRALLEQFSPGRTPEAAHDASFNFCSRRRSDPASPARHHRRAGGRSEVILGHVRPRSRSPPSPTASCPLVPLPSPDGCDGLRAVSARIPRSGPPIAPVITHIGCHALPGTRHGPDRRRRHADLPSPEAAICC